MSEQEHKTYDIFIAEQKQINERFTKAFESLSNTMVTMSSDVKATNNSMHKVEILLEKISNLDAKIEDNNKRVHKRIDNVEKAYNDSISELKSKQSKEIDDLKKSVREDIKEVKEEHIEPIKKSLDWAWKTLFGKLLVLIAALLTIVYKTIS